MASARGVRTGALPTAGLGRSERISFNLSRHVSDFLPCTVDIFLGVIAHSDKVFPSQRHLFDKRIDHNLLSFPPNFLLGCVVHVIAASRVADVYTPRRTSTSTCVIVCSSIGHGDCVSPLIDGFTPQGLVVIANIF
ncbi:MAG: hypothetical protein ACRDTS_11130 [Mycobacterium sp.]